MSLGFAMQEALATAGDSAQGKVAVSRRGEFGIRVVSRTRASPTGPLSSRATSVACRRAEGRHWGLWASLTCSSGAARRRKALTRGLGRLIGDQGWAGGARERGGGGGEGGSGSWWRTGVLPCIAAPKDQRRETSECGPGNYRYKTTGILTAPSRREWSDLRRTCSSATSGGHDRVALAARPRWGNPKIAESVTALRRQCLVARGRRTLEAVGQRNPTKRGRAGQARDAFGSRMAGVSSIEMRRRGDAHKRWSVPPPPAH